MATLTAQTIAAAGDADITWTAADAGLSDQVVFQNNLALLVDNAGGSTCIVTVASEYTDQLGSTSADNVVSVLTGDFGIIPLSSIYKDGTGDVVWTYDQIASVNVAVVVRW